MLTSQYSNIAFISYKREDEKWAKWLQKKLEHYKLPTEIRKQNPDLEFANNPRHIFRDTTDLSGGVLAKAIKEGLDSSKFLIVICSPHAAKSPWVCKEVQEFIDSGREEYIIPFIIDGEPYSQNIEKECFPETLKTLAGERELLGISINENGRDSAAIRVVAYMFNLKFDTLWKRSLRDARRKRNLTIAGLILSIVVLLGIVIAGAWSYKEIKSANYKMMESQSRAVAEKARQKIAEGDVYDAMLALLEVLPEDKTDTEIPYTPEAEAALRVALDSCYSSSWKKHQLTDADRYLFSPNGNQILSMFDEDSISILKVLDANSLKDICKIQRPDDYSYISYSDDETKICIGYDKYVEVYDICTGKLILKGNFDDTKFRDILCSYNPVEISDTLLSEISDFPNTLTYFFKPENTTSRVQVVDYLPQKKWILYKKVRELDKGKHLSQESYILWDNANDEVLWELTDTVYISSNIVHANLSHYGNHIIISYHNYFEVIDTEDFFVWRLNTGDGYVTHEAKMTKDENFIFEYFPSQSFVTHIYDVNTLECVDSINAYPMMPESVCFDRIGDKYIINYMHQSDYNFQSYLYFKTNHLLKEPQDISQSLVHNDVNSQISRVKNSNNDSILVFNDHLKHKWECKNAYFLGYTEDMQYVAVEKQGNHFFREYLLLEITSGLCMYRWSTKNLEDATFKFLPYKELIKTCRELVHPLKLSDASIREFYL